MRSSRKIQSTASLSRIVREAKANGQQVVLTNGCFDLLHAGHVQLLERAKQLGDLLIVAINSDTSVRKLKGAHRPIVKQQDRARLLAALESVDYVTIFNESTPRRLVARLKPQILIKGADWGASEIVGREIVEQNGGRVVRLPLLRGYSTTRFIERIRQS